ncbi:MAG: small basic family protein [Fimbriimonadales bacterium]
MIVLPLLALLLGFAAAVWFKGLIGPVEPVNAQYFAVGCVAGLDTLCGGIRSGLEGKFYTDVFVTGFLSNVLIAFGMAWLGDQIGVNLFLAAVLVMGGRIFTNLSLIRRLLLAKWQESRDRQKRAAAETPAP